MATDFPDECTPEPLVLRPGMSAVEADLELALNENKRLRLELATARAQRDELEIQYRATKETLRRVTRKERTP